MRKRDTFNCLIKFILQNHPKHPELQFHRIIGVQINLKNKIVFFFSKRFLAYFKENYSCSKWFSLNISSTNVLLQKYSGNKRSGKVKSKFTREQNAGDSHPHTSGPSPPGMSYTTTKIYLASVKAAKARILPHVPL